MKNAKTFYVCNECGYKTARWLGKCPDCGSWNSLTEETEQVETPTKQKHVSVLSGDDSHAVAFSELEIPEYIRLDTGLGELDRVLGGGLVVGSVVLLAGEPGIGKSTLLMQISDSLGANKKVLYVSGEESGGQLRLRAERLQIKGASLSLLTETRVERIVREIDSVKPNVVIIDSIQTMYSDVSASAPGSVSQVKESAMAFISKAKAEDISIILVGHVNKEGGIAGPKVLEHMVDAVLYFEGERQQSYRIIRASKNRYGSTNEIGVFEMNDTGLREVANPSEMLLDGRPINVPGNCAVCVMEGSRPIIAEVQSLVTPTVFPAPRRTSNGLDYSRVCLILAVLEKRLGQRFSTTDVYMNVIGGLKIDEPASDLAVAMTALSCLTDRLIPDDMIVIGELGLSGECRPVSNIDQRIKEAARLGFKTAVVPQKNAQHCKPVDGITLIPVHGIIDTVRLLKKQDTV